MRRHLVKRRNEHPQYTIGARQRIRRCDPLFARKRPTDDNEENARLRRAISETEGVSRAFNQALEGFFSTGDMFGNVGRRGTPAGITRKNTPDERNRVNREQRDVTDGALEGYEGMGGAENDEDDEDTRGGGEGSEKIAMVAAEDDRRPMWRRIAQRRSDRAKNSNRMLRARAESSAAIVVDGPFQQLHKYMTLPVSEYSLLDSSLIHRVSHDTFRFQVPLKEFVGLDLTPTMEVEVKADEESRTVVFRSTRSTLYGQVSNSDTEEAWRTLPPGRIEYFRVSFDARLKWVKGDASVEPVGRRGFAGPVTRRSRPPSSRDSSSGTPHHNGASSESNGRTDASGGTLSRNEPAAAAQEAEARAQRGTISCATSVRVQVILPPPYNTVLPWRLVRALMGKMLSTIVAYILPRFLELLADDFYGWSSGKRKSAATAREVNRTLLGSTRDHGTTGQEAGKRDNGVSGAARPGMQQRLRNMRPRGIRRVGVGGVGGSATTAAARPTDGIGAEEGSSTETVSTDPMYLMESDDTDVEDAERRDNEVVADDDPSQDGRQGQGRRRRGGIPLHWWS